MCPCCHTLLATMRCGYNAVKFLQNIHKRHPRARPNGHAMGCVLWVQTDILPPFLQWCEQYHVILDRVMTALDCMYLPMMVYISNLIWWSLHNIVNVAYGPPWQPLQRLLSWCCQVIATYLQIGYLDIQSTGTGFTNELKWLDKDENATVIGAPTLAASRQALSGLAFTKSLYRKGLGIGYKEFETFDVSSPISSCFLGQLWHNFQISWKWNLNSQQRSANPAYENNKSISKYYRWAKFGLCFIWRKVGQLWLEQSIQALSVNNMWYVYVYNVLYNVNVVIWGLV